MNILLTGGCGYIGSVLTEKLLEDGHQVVVVDTQPQMKPMVLVVQAWLLWPILGRLPEAAAELLALIMDMLFIPLLVQGRL